MLAGGWEAGKQNAERWKKLPAWKDIFRRKTVGWRK